MPNYRLTAGAQFTPFTFEQMIQPYQIYTEAYRDVENQLNTLQTQSDIWKALADDAQTKGLYSRYSNDLQNIVDDLANNGLNRKNRQQLLNMRKRYASEIMPMEQAYQNRAKRSEMFRQAIAKDPSLLYDRDPGTYTLGEYMANPELGYNSYSGNMLTSQAAAAAQPLAKWIRQNQRTWDTILGGMYASGTIQAGYTPSEILGAIARDPNSPAELRRIIMDTYNQSGIDSWGDASTRSRAFDYIANGIWQAIGTKDIKELQLISPSDYAKIMQGPQPIDDSYALPFGEGAVGDVMTNDNFENVKLDGNGNLTSTMIEDGEGAANMVTSGKFWEGLGKLHAQSLIPSSFIVDSIGSWITGNKSLAGSAIDDLQSSYKTKDELRKELNNMYEKYKDVFPGLSKDQVVMNGYRMEQRSKQQNVMYRPNIGITNQNKLINDMEYIIGSFSDQLLKGSDAYGLVPIDPDYNIRKKKSLSYEDTQKLLKSGIGNVLVGNQGLVVTFKDSAKGTNMFLVKGPTEIDTFNNRIRALDQGLSNYNIDKSLVYRGNNTIPDDPKYYRDLGGGFRAFTTFGNGTYNNVVIDNYGNIVGISNASDEVNNGGRTRSAWIKRYASDFFRQYGLDVSRKLTDE